MMPPCQDMMQESNEVRQCCKLHASLYKSNNIQQVMSIMKYSLELSNPWIFQYYKTLRGNGIIYDKERIKQIPKVWMAENKNEALKIFPGKINLDFFRQFG